MKCSFFVLQYFSLSAFCLHLSAFLLLFCLLSSDEVPYKSLIFCIFLQFMCIVDYKPSRPICLHQFWDFDNCSFALFCLLFYNFQHISWHLSPFMSWTFSKHNFQFCFVYFSAVCCVQQCNKILNFFAPVNMQKDFLSKLF